MSPFLPLPVANNKGCLYVKKKSSKGDSSGLSQGLTVWLCVLRGVEKG